MTITDPSSQPKFGHWKHKNGGSYQIIYFGLVEKTMEPCVVYMSLSNGTIWVRPCWEFFDGRFERVV